VGMILTRTTNFHGYLKWIEDGGGYTTSALEHLVHAMRADAGGAKHSGEGRLRPSLIGDQCDRKQILSYKFSHGSSFHGSWEAHSGTWLHLAFPSYLLDAYPTRVRIEHAVRPKKGGLGVTGKADWFWYGPPDIGEMEIIKGPHLGDYKTIGDIKWVTEAPREKHIEQVMYEMFTLDIRKAYLVYQNRNFGGAMLTWEVTAEDEDFKRS